MKNIKKIRIITLFCVLLSVWMLPIISNAETSTKVVSDAGITFKESDSSLKQKIKLPKTGEILNVKWTLAGRCILIVTTGSIYKGHKVNQCISVR